MTVLTPVKLCRDCVFKRDGQIWPVCTHPSVPLDDLSTGEHKMAKLVRDYGPCGREGRLFKPFPVRTEVPERDRLTLDMPELEPLPGGRRVSWWNRMRARVLLWTQR